MSINLFRSFLPTLAHRFEIALHHPLRFTQSEVAFTLYTRSASYDVSSKTVLVEIADDMKGYVIEHILGLALYPEDGWTLSLSHMESGGGGETRRIERFDGLTLKSHRATYDYGVGEQATHTLEIAYRDLTVLR